MTCGLHYITVKIHGFFYIYADLAPKSDYDLRSFANGIKF